MPLDIHPKASENLDARGERLLTSLRPPSEEHLPAGPSFVPDTPVAWTLTEKDILGIECRLADGRGVTIARYFYRPGSGQLGFAGSSFDELRSLAKTTYGLVSDVVSAQTVEDFIFHWCRDRSCDVTDLPLVQYVMSQLEVLIANHEIWLPIATLYLERPLSLGRVVLRPISSEDIDSWTARWTDAEGSAAAKAAAIDDLRNRLQGLAAATSTYRAERHRAEERAAEATEDALSILRIFSAEILHPYAWSLCTVEGLASVGGNLSFVHRDGVFASMLQALPEGLRLQWKLSESRVDELLRIGLKDADELLRQSERTDFENTLLKALRHYSIAALKKDPSEKLLYIVTALESLLLGGPEEGRLVQNFRERFAILRGRDLASRLETQRRASAIYAIRSRFVHGGFPAEDLGLLEEFMLDAWTVMISILKKRKSVRSKAEFLQTLDLHKMAGPPFGSIRLAN